MPLLMHPFFRNIQLFSKVIGPSIHDPIQIGFLVNVIGVVLFNLDFSGGEPVNCFTLCNITQIRQIFFRNIQSISGGRCIVGRIAGVTIDTIKGVAKVKGSHGIHQGTIKQARNLVINAFTKVVPKIKSGPVFKPIQLQIISVHFRHYFRSLAKGFINPTAKGITPSLNRPGKVGTKDSVNGRSKRLKHPKHRISQIKEQMNHSRHRIIEYCSNEVGNRSHKVIDQNKHFSGHIPQGNEDVADKGQRRHKHPADNAGGGNTGSSKLVHRRHSRIEQGDQRNDTDDDPSNGTGQQSGIQPHLCAGGRGGCRRFRKGGTGLNSRSGGGNCGKAVCNGLNGVIGDHGSVKNHISASHTQNDWRNPTPIINNPRSAVDQQIKNPCGNRSNGGKAIDNTIGHGFKLGAVGDLVQLVQDRGEDGKGLILHGSPDLAPSLGHTIEFFFNIISRRKHGVLDNIGADLPFRSHCSDLTNGNIQIISNILNNAGGIFKNAVQFLTTKNTGSHGLCKLKHGSRLFLGACSTIHEGFIDQFGKHDHFIHVPKGVLGVHAQLGNSGGGVHVIRTGTLCRSHYLCLQFFKAPAIIKIHHGIVQPGIGACKLVRNPKHLIQSSNTTHGGRNSLQLVPKAIGGGRTGPDRTIEFLLLVIGIPDTLFDRIKSGFRSCQFITGFLNCRNINRIAGSPLHGFKAVQHNIHGLLHTVKRGSHTIIQGNSRADRCQ
nr:MAG TPA: hypothetical protein [Caudoviricetes sp.]